MTYEEAWAKLMKSGWQPGDPVPAEMMAAAESSGLGGEGTQEDPLQLPPMTVTGGGGAPPPLAETAPGGEMGPPESRKGMAPDSGVFAGMSEEDAQKYAGMGDLKHQRDRAQAMRDTEDAEGRYVNQGRTFVAASPLEHLVVGAKRYKGKKDEEKVGGKQTEGRKSLIDLLRNKSKRDLTDEEIAEGEGWTSDDVVSLLE